MRRGPVAGPAGQDAKGANAGAAAKPAPAMPVKAVAARLAPAVEETSAVGTLRADEAISLRPEIAGRIVEIHFNEGQNVARGAKLVSLDSAELSATLASSSSDLKLNQQRLERAEDLFKKNFISQQALDEARSNLAKSRAKQQEDQAKLAKTELRAPFPGVMGLRQVSQGAVVVAGTDIARLEKIDQLKLDFRVPETFLSKVKSGQVVRIAVDAYPDDKFSGAIYAIEPGVDEQTRTVVVRARVANAGLRLRPGMFVRVQLQLGERRDAVWIPEQAIVPRGQDSYVYRVMAGKAELVQVRTGARRVGEVEVLRGVAAGDLVVTEGTQKIGPGSAVSVMDGAAKPAPAAPAAKG
ncbi:MAG: efflux RND transporter periplasmic adaptor subunit [Betaproteobacteria bacterium]|nr:efflux RND transporter periplasmic adaptor subunit [Betaproteobacteria bacterium]